MLVQLRKGVLVLRSQEDDAHLADWLLAHAGQVFRLRQKGGAALLHALGPEAEARREPINITSRSPEPRSVNDSAPPAKRTVVRPVTVRWSNIATGRP